MDNGTEFEDPGNMVPTPGAHNIEPLDDAEARRLESMSRAWEEQERQKQQQQEQPQHPEEPEMPGEQQGGVDPLLVDENRVAEEKRLAEEKRRQEEEETRRQEEA